MIIKILSAIWLAFALMFALGFCAAYPQIGLILLASAGVSILTVSSIEALFGD